MKRIPVLVLVCLSAGLMPPAASSSDRISTREASATSSQELRREAFRARRVLPERAAAELSVADAGARLSASSDRSRRHAESRSERDRDLSIYSMIISGLGVAMLSFVRHLGKFL
ncbi:MAG: hypothetical protein QM776_08460 [Rhodocyclaceae bacterium]